jgi:hypothetical protein
MKYFKFFSLHKFIEVENKEKFEIFHKYLNEKELGSEIILVFKKKNFTN